MFSKAPSGGCRALALPLLEEKPAAPSLPKQRDGAWHEVSNVPLLSHGHGEAEIRIRVCRNLHLSERPAIHRLRRKGRSVCAASSCTTGEHPHHTLLAEAALLPPFCPRSLYGARGTLTSREEGHPAAPMSPVPQELNPCPSWQLGGKRDGQELPALPWLRSAATAAAGSARSQRAPRRLSITWAGAVRGGWGTSRDRHPSPRELQQNLGGGSEVGAELLLRVLPCPCWALTMPSVHPSHL